MEIPHLRGRIIVANRGSGALSVIDAHTAEVTATIPLPGTTPDPMCVVPIAAMNRVFGGDRAYSASRRDPIFVYVKTIQVGTNPFGLACVP